MADTLSQTVYRLSPATASEDRRLGELKEFKRQGETFIRQQRGYVDSDRALDIISGRDDERIPRSLSRVRNNQLKRDVREVVATVSNIKNTWNYTAGNRENDPKVQGLNKRQEMWYYNTFADLSFQQAIQWAGVFGTGWISPRWKRNMWGYGTKADISLKILSFKEVLPVQMPLSNDIQESYIVTLVEEMPINMAAAFWPEAYAQGKIVPDRDFPSGVMRASNPVTQFLSPVLDTVARMRGKERLNTSTPTVDVYYTYVMDLSLNDSDKERMMGEQGTTWSYKVPPKGSYIPTGIRDASGTVLSRPAEASDLLLYPNRRLVIWTNHGILRDGPNYNLDGQVPIIPFRLDPWPWEFLGFSMVRDAASIQTSIQKLLRSIDDSQNARLRPPIGFDENQHSENFMRKFDPRIPGTQIPVNMMMGDSIKVLMPSQYYDVPNHIPQHIQWLDSQRKQILGLNDAMAVAKAKQVPASDSIEKIMEMAGAIMGSIERNIELSCVQVADQWKGLALQHYSTVDRMLKLGMDGVTEEDTDYDPGTMIPSHMQGEDKSNPSIFSFAQRAKMTMESISTLIKPHSALQISNISKRMTMLLLLKSGQPVDWWTIAKAFEIENFSPEPAGTKNVLERWMAQQHIMRELAQEMQSGMSQQGQGQKGRPNSGNAPPKAETKDQGSRVTLSTSK